VRLTTVVLVLFMALACASNAFAIAAGKTVEFEPKGAAKVIFDGKSHADAGAKCTDCHTKVFQMKKGTTKITMTDMNAGKTCGVCHNGEKAFKSNDPANCAKCHKK
jgi:c(7)-type cytochrome triheme protein